MLIDMLVNIFNWFIVLYGGAMTFVFTFIAYLWLTDGD
jgi:hypothetical protein